MGVAGIYSFFPSKSLGGFGDGGAVTAKEPALLKKIRMYSNHGREDKYRHEFEGINSRLDALQAALLRVCLAQLDKWNAHRRQAAQWYNEGLAEVPGVTLPQVLPDTEPVYHLYVIQVSNRNVLQTRLKNLDVESAIHYPMPLHVQPAYARLKQGIGAFPEAEWACAHILSLPMHPAITREEVQQVCASIALSLPT